MEVHVSFIALGIFFIVGLAADEIGRRTKLPRVTLLILFGVLAGPTGFDVVPKQAQSWYEPLATIALTMVAFLLGGTLSLATLKIHGRRILLISLSVVGTTILFVATGLTLLGTHVVIALILAAIATATAPAATFDVLQQAKAEGRFSDTLRGIVAVDDAWGLVVFSVILVCADTILGNGTLSGFRTGLYELVGSIALGGMIGLPAAYLTGRIRDGQPMQAEALGIVFLSAGLSQWLDLSFLIVGIVCGMVVVNLAKHHRQAFHEIEHIEWPFMILFFFLAGVSLQIGDASGVLLIVVVFVLLRLIARIVGGWLGALISRTEPEHRIWYGVALLPQAGVAVGMALIAGQKFPEFQTVILSTTLLATVIFEIFGPLATLFALRKVGDAKE